MTAVVRHRTIGPKEHDLLEDQPSGLGGRGITIVASLLAAYVFGSTAWQQFVAVPTGPRVLFTGVFAALGAGVVWVVYLVVRLVVMVVRRLKGP